MMINKIQVTKADIIVRGSAKNPYYEMGFLNKYFKNKIFNYQDLGEKVFSIPASPPSKLYKKELIFDIRFPEGIIFEDNPFFIEAILKADKVYFYDSKNSIVKRLAKNFIK